MIIDQKILPLAALPQPVPSIYKGGDCGACVLGGLLLPDYHDVEVVYTICRGDVDSFAYTTMTNSLFHARANGLIRDFIHSVPTWGRPECFMQYGTTSWQVANEWFDYIKIAILAGYYGVASVDAFGKSGEIDHWVLMKGFRIRAIPIKGHPKAKRISKDLLISNSSTQRPDLKWIPVARFLRKHGGYNAILVRPLQTEQ